MGFKLKKTVPVPGMRVRIIRGDPKNRFEYLDHMAWCGAVVPIGTMGTIMPQKANYGPFEVKWDGVEIDKEFAELGHYFCLEWIYSDSMEILSVPETGAMS